MKNGAWIVLLVGLFVAVFYFGSGGFGLDDDDSSSGGTLWHDLTDAEVSALSMADQLSYIAWLNTTLPPARPNP